MGPRGQWLLPPRIFLRLGGAVRLRYAVSLESFERCSLYCKRLYTTVYKLRLRSFCARPRLLDLSVYSECMASCHGGTSLKAIFELVVFHFSDTRAAANSPCGMKVATAACSRLLVSSTSHVRAAVLARSPRELESATAALHLAQDRLRCPLVEATSLSEMSQSSQ